MHEPKSALSRSVDENIEELDARGRPGDSWRGVLGSSLTAWGALGLALALTTSCAGRADRPTTEPPAPVTQDAEDFEELDEGDEERDEARPSSDPTEAQTPEAGAPREASEDGGGGQADEADDSATEGDRGPEPLSRLAGQYSFAGGQNQRNAVRKSVDGVVDDMNVLVRRIARRRLNAANDVPARIAIQPNGDELTVAIDDRAYTGKIGGPSVRVRNSEGGISRMRLRLRGDKLYQVFNAKDGQRINVFVPRQDGDGVTMIVTMKSDRLPSPLRYRLSYR